MNGSASDDFYQPWKLLQRGDYAEALRSFRNLYLSEKGPGRKRGLGEALMWVGYYSESASHFRESIDRDADHQYFSNEEDFAFLGAAEWCLGNYESAVKAWKLGTAAKYSIGGCRTHCPLLLFLASVLRPHLSQRDRTEKDLLKRLNSRRAMGWPASEARFALGLIDEKALEASWPVTPPLNRRLLECEVEWKRDFYKVVRDAAAGTKTLDSSRRIWGGLSVRSRYESADAKKFYRIISIPEFFIAYHESTSSC